MSVTEQGSIHEAQVEESDKIEGEIVAQSDSQTELMRASSRLRTMTEKGLEYEISLWEGRFKASVSRWRNNVSKMSVCLSDENDADVIRSNRNALEVSMRDVGSAFSRLTDLRGLDSPEIQSFSTLFESLEEENQKFMCKIADRICELQHDLAETASRSSRRSYQSLKSRLSKASYRSRHSDAAAEAAALKAKLKYIDAEMRSKAEFEKITTQRKLEMAQAKIGVLEPESVKLLDSLKFGQTERELKAGRTREYVMTHSNATFEFKPSLEPFPKVDPEKSNLNPAADQYIPGHYLSPTEVPMADNLKATQIDSNETCMKVSDKNLANVSHETCGNASQETSLKVSHATCEEVSHKDILEITKTLAEQAYLSRLPPPEPSVFDGDPLKYPSWKAAFHTLIEQKRIPSSENIHYLKKYLSGSVREVIENYFLLSSEDAYDEAKRLLEQRYGDPFVIGNAFRNKLANWPKIQPRDSFGLRKFSDFLKQCFTAMDSIKGLSCLDDDRENRKLLHKIPEWMVNRWNRFVVQYKEKEKQFPPFKEFMLYVEREAKIACDPITSLHALRQDQTQTYTDKPVSHPKSDRRPAFRGRTLLTEANNDQMRGPETESKPYRKECTLCHKGHDIDDCRLFLSKSVEDRKSFVREKQLCFGCLSSGHISKRCKHRKQCRKCKKQHPTSLHGDTIPKQSNREATSVKEIMEGQSTVDRCSASMLGISYASHSRECQMSSMILPVYLSHDDYPGTERLVYALLDSQSDTTFILEDTCRALGLEGVEVDLMLSTMTAENMVVKTCKIKGLSVRGFSPTMKIQLPTAYSRQIMPANRSHIPSPEMAKKWPHLLSIASELMPLQDCEIGLLIGYNCAQALLPRDVIAPVTDGPYAQRTDLGWGIVGIVEDGETDDFGVSHNIVSCQVPPNWCRDPSHPERTLVSFQTKMKEVIKPSDVASMMELDFSEMEAGSRAMSFEDYKFLSLLQNEIHLKDGHYEMPLPFKSGRPALPNNRSLAIHRLKHLRKKLESDNRYRDHYCAFMKDIIEKGHAEIVPEPELKVDIDSVWYVPHHGVYHPKKRDKLRVVFDCSAKFNGVSLNDQLLQGPDLTNTLVGVLNRFRKEPVAFICDIEQMFHQFRVISKDRNYLRFLWWKNGDCSQEPVEFRMCVHLFGAVSSPGCANYALKQVAADNETEFGSVVAVFVKRDFYVDDGLKSVPTAEDAIELIDKSRKMCSKGGIRLHKFLSNSKEVLDRIPPEDLAKGLKDLDLVNDTLPVERALGIQWCTESDSFQFRLTLNERPMTRRGILSTLNSVYDPLGFLAPIVLTGKQILQEMCRENADWDTPLPDHLKQSWQKWITDLRHLESLKIPRCVKPSHFGQVKAVELHHFSDASSTGYGQCTYIRLIDDNGQVHCSLLMGKARVAPLKSVTIPRLELVAALLSTKISMLLQKELEYTSVKEWFWTDSNIVLGYIGNESRRFHVFVANRVQQIRDHTEPYQWQYISTSENPADIASRGAKVQDLMNRPEWLSGPEFLWKNEPYQPEAQVESKLSSDDPEIKRAKVFETLTHVTRHTSILQRLEYFSDWQRAKRAIARCLKYKETLLKQVKKDDTPSLIIKVINLQKAETEIIRQLQHTFFEEEINFLSQKVHQPSESRSKFLKKNSPLYKLDPFLDNNGLLRVGGRLRWSDLGSDVKHPIILPRKSHVTNLVITHFHAYCQHQGRGLTTNTIRASGFWIIGCSSAVGFVISKCVTCRKLRSTAQGQKMSDLPSDRLEATPPFVYSAVDYFGPWLIREGRKELKRYGVLFTCLSCRAVHVETANSLDTDSFINALRRFLSIRGPIRLLRSDRGTNFVGAARELREAVGEMDISRVTQFLQNKGCDFQFKMNVPSASHMGGVWERQIRSVRNILNTLLDQSGTQLDDESLRTFMCETASIINSRPLTVDNLNDPLSPEPLTPNHLLTMKSEILLPPPGEFQQPDLYSRKRWRRVQYLANQFWYRWKREFLQNLQRRSKWSGVSRNMRVGDIVLINEENTPRNQWHMGRVVEAHVDEDGLVRKTKLMVGSCSLNSKGERVEGIKYLERPIHKLILLLESQT